MPNTQVRTDVFPARLTIKNTNEEDSPIQRYDRVRVILTLDHVYVFQDSGAKPRVIFEDRLTSYTPPPKKTRQKSLGTASAIALTEEGYECSFLKAGGCGCGSRLKTAKVSSLLENTSISQAASKNDSI